MYYNQKVVVSKVNHLLVKHNLEIKKRVIEATITREAKECTGDEDDLAYQTYKTLLRRYT